jgi:uncharacterized protein (DUF2235 family)
MFKRIAYCADGTWDNATSRTNVIKIHGALTTSADQVNIYDSGLGTTGEPIGESLGGAFGTGIWRKIRHGYAHIAQLWEPGDEIFLFGFSRGAYTARSLAGMIAACGLPAQGFTDDLVDQVFDAYRDRDDRAERLARLSAFNLSDAPITMIGVWDTVGSLGIPAIFGRNDPIVYGFLDTALHPNVRNAYHALAVDEKRRQFPATLWDEPAAPGQVLDQVWFTGVHSDVGGGEPDDTPGHRPLSDITLAWMMGKASALGLKFDAEALMRYPLPLEPETAMAQLHKDPGITDWLFPTHRKIPASAKLANSVALRAQHDSSYRPKSLQFVNDALASSYSVETVVAEPFAAAAGAH